MTVSSFTALGVLVSVCVGALLAPLVDPRGSFWLLAVVVALVIYHGLRPGVIYAGFFVLFGVELLYGFPPAVLSLAYLLAAYVFTGMQRFISMTPWSQRDDWTLGEGFQATLLSWIFSWSAMLTSVLIGAVLYDSGMIQLRIQSLLDTSFALALFFFSAIVLVAARRMTIPFRRAILFGS